MVGLRVSITRLNFGFGEAGKPASPEAKSITASKADFENQAAVERRRQRVGETHDVVV